MQTKQFRAFLVQTQQLTPQQRKQTLEQLQKRSDINTVETALDTVESCPHCGSTNPYRVGYNVIKLRTYLLPPEVETSVPQSHEMGHFWWE